MVSMVETSHSNHNDMALDQVAKSEPLAEGSISSAVSTPDPEAEILMTQEAQSQNIQKRKGGRKPVSDLESSSGGLCPFIPFSLFVITLSLQHLHNFPTLIYPSSHLLVVLSTMIFFYLASLFGPGPRITFFFQFIIPIDHPYLAILLHLFSLSL
jgi:hypothetical protein